MLAVIGQDINLTASSMFDNERAYLYQRMQRKLSYELANRKNTVRTPLLFHDRYYRQLHSARHV
ncbi:hypothetical protein DPMN_173538 [Dreissena polymorpha]|uniref:Uncharacterized protein n=1 Tax=Dreissena polymorpha TaxID=45954 RepID=A0A9D4E3K1_DREPO|nr:hypothetical protein DPMN_173505 [Dreissena polymorpha]KAH3772174.1 hypothetical protein DPMN_173511 [Dreissena polymorpha]KAH3772200.1 hypothetical protein DPMN_173538 [Dreissena polymorpha]